MGQPMLSLGITCLCFFNRCPQPDGPPPGTVGCPGSQPAGLDLNKLEASVQYYFAKGLAPSTQRTYKSGKDQYLKFCQQANVAALPVTEPHLCSFASRSGAKIPVYLLAIRHLQISAAQPDPFGGAPMSRLEYVLRGIKKWEAEQGAGPRERLPITPSLLVRMKEVWEPTGGEWDSKLLWAACCLCFFAFLRAGETTVPSDKDFDPSVHLCVGDVAIDDPAQPSMFRVTIKQSKTDPFRKGVNLFVGRTYSPVCPVAAVLDYLAVRGTEPGPLFRYEDGRVDVC